MSNRIRIDVMEEQPLDIHLQPTGEKVKSLYIHCDGATSWLGNIQTLEDAYALITPDVIEETFNQTLSQDELDIFAPLVIDMKKDYSFYGQTFNISQAEK